MSTLLRTFEERAERQANDIAFTVFGDAARRRTWREWHNESLCFANALVHQGIMPGESVAILAGNHEVWPVADLGALMAGAISVGVYPTSSVVQVHEILNDCAARVVVVDTDEQLAKVLEVRSALPNLKAVVGPADWHAWIGAGRKANDAEVRRRSADADPNDVAILIYTSGSTGIPKGARITHRTLSASAKSIADTLQLTDKDSALSFLPYCHAAERIFGLYTRIHAGMSAMLVETSQVWEAARTYEPTVFGGLPRFYEKIYEAVSTRPATVTTQQCIAAMIGGRVRIATSGGATLPRQIGEYLADCGLVVLGAYGLTEHLCAAMHRASDYSFDSVGPAMPGTTFRIGENGEILIKRSDLTFSGYQNQPAETRAAFTDDGEWLRTGDLGYLDDRGHLHVIGREKELIALSGGKKVAPVPIERKLTESSWISQAVLFGENRRYISALLVLCREQVEQWAGRNGIGARYEDLITHPELLRLVQREVDAVNALLSRPEQIKRFAVLKNELRAETEELTATLKVRRAFVAEKYQMQLEALYA